MNSIPLHQNNHAPTLQQLFGTNYKPEYIKHLPEEINFSEPIVPRLDFSYTKKRLRRFWQLYNYNLLLEYPYPDWQKTKGRKKMHPEYKHLHLNKGTICTLHSLMDFFSGYLAQLRSGKYADAFKVSCAAIASTQGCSPETILTHLKKLHVAGIIERIKGFPHHWDTGIEFCPRFLRALPDRKYALELVNTILLKAPELAGDENFLEWQKRLNPSFFSVSSPSSPKFFRTFLLKQESNNNSHSGIFVNGGNYVSPQTPFLNKNQGSESPDEPKSIGKIWLGARKPKSNVSCGKDKNNSPGAILNEKEYFTERAFNLIIGILWKWWAKDIDAGRISHAEIQTAKDFISHWIFKDGISNARNYIYGTLSPTLHNQARWMNKVGWDKYVPQLYLYFDPNCLTDDGAPANYARSILYQEKNVERIKQRIKEKRFRIGSKKVVRDRNEKSEMLAKALWFVMRKASDKNYYKALNKILYYGDEILLHQFIRGVISSKVMPVKFMEKQKLLYKISIEKNIWENIRNEAQN